MRKPNGLLYFHFIDTHKPQDPDAIRRLFSSIAPRYDLANHVLCGGIDVLWRRRAARIVRQWNPRRILDLATGSGDLALTLAKHCPDAEIVGSDFCHPMLVQARAKGLKFVVTADALALPFEPESFDVATVAFGLRNMESYPRAIASMSRVLRPGGHLLVLDFSLPPAPLRTPYRFYLHHILPSVAGALTGEKSAYAYLGESIEQFPQGDGMTALLKENGFSAAHCEPLTGGIVSLYTAERASPQNPPTAPEPSAHGAAP